ncbi:hypothetical protein Pelo_18383 [Pelomyxa schiedti]|nr:hypothetical protein Pelo_18383 [Pelomyxa schiedti]
MAKAMLGLGASDGGQCLWDGWGVVGWGLLDKENVGISCSCTVCVGGNLDVVKWLVGDVIGVGEHRHETTLYLEFSGPLRECLIRGKTELFKWLFKHLEITAPPLHPSGYRNLFLYCAMGKCPGNLKWCLENLQVRPDKEIIVGTLLNNRHTTAGDCEWAESHVLRGGLSSWNQLMESVRNVDVAKWMLSLFPTETPTEEAFNCLCKNTGDVEFVEWLINEKNCTPTAESFASACSTSAKNGSSLARFLATLVTLSESNIIHSMVQALCWNNTEVAKWLEDTFHVMQSIDTNTEIAGNALEEICSGYHVYKEKLVGLQWFIQHLSSPSSLSMTSIHQAISQALRAFLPNTVAFVLESFPQFDPHIDQSQFQEITLAFMKSNLPALQRLSQLVAADGSSLLLTPELATQCLTSSSFHRFSSKAVKWVIRKFNLQYNHIRANNNMLLFKLLSGKKNGCVQWLLQSFDIPLTDIFDMARTCSEYQSLDIVGWKSLVRHYPIDGAVIRSHFIPMISKSPHVAIHIIHSFGITLNEFRDYLEARTYHNLFEVPDAPKLWLAMPLS